MLNEQTELVRAALYRQLARTGALPSREDFAGSLGLAVREYDAALGELAATRNVILRGDDVEMAHPFATRSFGFSVMGPETLWWGGCAWDAFAIPNLVPEAPSVLVATTCPSCRTPHAWTVTNQGAPAGDQLAHFLTPADEIWPDAAHACENQLIFCNEGCVDSWLELTGNRRGYVMTLETLWRLAAHWYDGRLGSPYTRREPAEAAAYFRSVGLRGAFWGLDESEEPTQGPR